MAISTSTYGNLTTYADSNGVIRAASDGTWTVTADGTHVWNEPDGTNPSEKQMEEMYALQKRIDAGEKVVIPEKQKAPEFAGYADSFVWGNVSTTNGHVTITAGNGQNSITSTYTNSSGPIALVNTATNPVQSNAKDKYTGKAMKYIKGIRNSWR